jgi:hypothetical protein
MKRSLGVLGFGVLVAGLLSSTVLSSAVAQQDQSRPGAVEPDSSAAARALLTRVGDVLAKSPGFSVTINSAADVVQGSGQNIEFGETRRVVLRRPDKLRIDLERRDGTKQLVVFDGKNVTMFSPAENVYAKLEKPGTVDQVIYYILEELKTPIPLSVLLLTTVNEELGKRITEIALVDKETLNGVAVDHLAARTEAVDFQAWVTEGDQPVPIRIVITYKNAEGRPQYSAMLSDWKFNPTVDASTFAFTPPANATPVVFMVPVAQQAPANAKGDK